MATKQFYATGDFRYQTRMLRAGEPVEMDGPTARLYKALDKISDQRPNAARAAPVKPKAAPRKAAAKKAPARKKAAAKK